LDVSHKGAANVPKEKLKELLSKKYKADAKNIVLFGFKTAFGGGKSTGFGLIYENSDYLLKYEPKGRLRKVKIM
jgi:small subunit ribosomal protein S24e